MPIFLSAYKFEHVKQNQKCWAQLCSNSQLQLTTCVVSIISLHLCHYVLMYKVTLSVARTYEQRKTSNRLLALSSTSNFNFFSISNRFIILCLQYVAYLGYICTKDKNGMYFQEFERCHTPQNTIKIYCIVRKFLTNHCMK